jgi:hypothetical protein
VGPTRSRCCGSIENSSIALANAALVVNAPPPHRIGVPAVTAALGEKLAKLGWNR